MVSQDDRKPRLLRADTGDPIVDVLHLATSMWPRFVGLQFRRPLPPGHGLMMVPCSSIHTMFVRFAIDVFFVSAEGAVTEVRPNVGPWRIVLPKGPAHAVLEAAAGSLHIEPGTPLAIDLKTDTVPSRLRFLSGTVNAAPKENEQC